jgi:hypothetical protein
MQEYAAPLCTSQQERTMQVHWPLKIFTDILWKVAGCSNELDYVEQTS